MADLLDNIIDFVLGNIGIVIFAVFLLSGLLGRGGKDKQQAPQQSQQRRAQSANQQDERPLAERLAEAFGVELPEEQPKREAKPSNYASEGRRSTITRNVQQQYPDLFGGPSLFESSAQGDDVDTKWGFDDTEWGSTFEKNDEQWGHSFPERKNSEPRIEWPS